MNDDLAQLFASLKLRKMAEIYDAEAQKGEKSGEPTSRLLARLLRAELHDRQERSLAARIKQAKLPEQWSLESFPFKRQPGVSQRQIRTLAELDFIGRAENIVFIGETNVGKTGLATGLLLKAMQNGYRGIFVSAQDLFDEMYASLADRSTRHLLNRLAHVDVLLVDELGYQNLKPEQTNIFFKLMHERHRRKPTILTSNLDYPEWHDFFGNAKLVEALLTRLRYKCHTIKINGPHLDELQG
jgi:DNA replication protein DnaC